MAYRILRSALFTRCLAFAALSVALVGPQSVARADTSLDTSMAPATPQQPYSVFQWALYSEGELLLVPFGDHYYPARRRDSGVIETHPVKLPIEFHHDFDGDGAPTAMSLTKVLSPFDVSPDGWVLERLGETGAWTPVASFRFHDMHFYALDTPGAFETVANDRIRFRRR